jgi:Na+/melibiose symporter-like transporter
MMRIGGSLLLIAIGAILTFAVNTDSSHGFNVNTAGVILMIVGGIGLLVSLVWMSTRRRTDVVHESPAAGGSRTTYRTPADPIDY